MFMEVYLFKWDYKEAFYSNSHVSDKPDSERNFCG